MLSVDAICQSLAQLAPLRLAESWDNVGLLVGDRRAIVDRVMTCLTITPAVVAEAVERQVGLIVTHHPLPFKPLAKITSDSTTGQLLLDLIANRIAVYSAHTAFDSAAFGINATWTEGLELCNVKPLEPADDWPDEGVGAGRYGHVAKPISLHDFAEMVSNLVAVPRCRIVASESGGKPIVVKKVAVACGSGGSLLGAAKRCGCDTMVTGEATFHTCLEAHASGVNLVLVGHYHSERFAMVGLVDLLSDLNDVEVFASQRDVDPLKELN